MAGGVTPSHPAASRYVFGRNFSSMVDATTDPQYSSLKQQKKQHSVPQESAEILQVYLPHYLVHKKMKKKEIAQQNKRSFRSHTDLVYLQHRTAMVEWMTQIGECTKMKSLTIHSAVYFMDLLLDCISFDASRLSLVGCACILISAKIEEKDNMVPRIDQLAAFAYHAWSSLMIRKMESFILNALKWEMTVIVPSHFVDYYLMVAFLSQDQLSNRHLPAQGVPELLSNTTHFFVDLSLQHAQFALFLPSLVAATAVVAARQLMRIEPIWNRGLEVVSMFTFEQIVPCLSALLGCYRQSFPISA